MLPAASSIQVAPFLAVAAAFTNNGVWCFRPFLLTVKLVFYNAGCRFFSFQLELTLWAMCSLI
jgi:hypothetical protein